MASKERGRIRKDPQTLFIEAFEIASFLLHKRASIRSSKSIH
jgi:hypothetical protein